MLSKKIGRKGNLLSVWWFLVLAVIGAGMIAGTSIFYASDIDIRVLQSEIITNKVVDCLINNGQVNPSVFSEDFNFFDTCDLNRNLIENSGFFYIKLSISGVNSKNLVFGNRAFEEDCLFASQLNAKAYPLCTQKKISSSYLGEKVNIEMTTGSNYKFVKK
ncbi:hypothetical protein FJZ17_00120 [Candidatus Pacearchaeota archaeon]|nr:hypothetical protein [Candidatus Pacearchaeota archaeon]